MDETSVADFSGISTEDLLSQAQAIADNPDATEEDRARFEAIMAEVSSRQSQEEMSRKLANVRKSVATLHSSPSPRKTLATQPTSFKGDKPSFEEQCQSTYYSQAKAIKAYSDGKLMNGWEGEFDEEMGRRHGPSKHSFRMPLNQVVGRNRPSQYALNLTTGAGAQPTAFAPGQIDYLRATSVWSKLESLGMQVYRNVDQATVLILRDGDPSFTWIGDTTNDDNPSNTTYATRTARVHNAICTIPMTRKFIQSTPDGEKYVSEQAEKAINLGVDYAILKGPGTGGDVLGLTSIPGIQANSVTFGGAPTWNKMIELETKVGQNNGLNGTGCYIINPKTRGPLKTTAKETGAAMGFLMESDGTVNGYPALVTSLMPSTLGASPSNKSAILFCGDVSQLHLFFYGPGIDVLVDPYTLSKSGATVVNYYLDMDFQAGQYGEFSLATDVQTS